MSVVHKQIREIVLHMYVSHNMFKSVISLLIVQSIPCSLINKTCLTIKKEVNIYL